MLESKFSFFSGTPTQYSNVRLLCWAFVLVEALQEEKIKFYESRNKEKARERERENISSSFIKKRLPIGIMCVWSVWIEHESSLCCFANESKTKTAKFHNRSISNFWHSCSTDQTGKKDELQWDAKANCKTKKQKISLSFFISFFISLSLLFLYFIKDDLRDSTLSARIIVLHKSI